MLESRGQAEVFGVVLLLGVSTLVIGGSLIAANGGLNELLVTSQSENGENSVSHIESDVSAVGIGDSSHRTVDFSRTSNGRYLLRPQAGRVSLTHTVEGTEQWNVTRRLGSIEYNSSNRDVAYQGGGVWARENGAVRMVSQPEFDYSQQSLTFPIIQIRERNDDTTSYERVTDATTLETDSLDFPLENGTVTVKITSTYYEGWYEYFDSQTEADATIYHSNNTAAATLAVPDTLVLDNAVSISTEYDAKGKQIVSEDELEENVPHESADPLITSKQTTAKTTNNNAAHSCISESGIDGNCELTAGTYYVDSDTTLSGDLTLDVSTGNITLVTNGDFDVKENTVEVVGDTENKVSYYVDNDFLLQGGAEVRHARDVGADNTDGDESQNQIFVGDQFTISSGGGNFKLEGIVYAPESSTEIGGNPSIEGALITYSLNEDSAGGSAEIRRGDLPSTYVLDVTGIDDTIRFMHVTTNRVTAHIQNGKLTVTPSVVPDQGRSCEWVDTQTSGGTESINIDGVVVDCDVNTDEIISVFNGGYVIGGVESDSKGVDVDGESTIIAGSITGEDTINVQDSDVAGSTTSREEDVKLSNASVDGSVTATKTAEAISGSHVGGDVTSHDRGVKILSSTVEGSIVAAGTVKLDDAVIHGDVYVDESNFDCTDSTINGQDCTSYTPK